MDIQSKPVIGAYVRVSTAEQAAGGVSVQQQKQELTRFIKGKFGQSHQVAWFIDDGVSSGIAFENRPAGGQLDRALRSGKVQVVVMKKLDRGFRSVFEMKNVINRWVEAGTEVRMLDMFNGDAISLKNPQNNLFMSIFGAFAEFERDMATQRTQDAVDLVKSNLARDNEHFSKRTGRRIEKLGSPADKLRETQRRAKTAAAELRHARAVETAPYFLAAIERAKKRVPAPFNKGVLCFEVIAHEFRQDPSLVIPMTKKLPTTTSFFDEKGRRVISARDASAGTIRRMFQACIESGLIKHEDFSK